MIFHDLMRFLEKPVARTSLRSICNNQFCDSICGLAQAAYQHNAVVTVSEQGKKLTSAVFSGKSFASGVCYFSTEDSYRLITAQSGAGVYGDSITLNRAFKTLATGQTVVCWEGCQKEWKDCNAFGNTDNFVGMCYLPLKDLYENPITN
jgi:hypothetical protein